MRSRFWRNPPQELGKGLGGSQQFPSGLVPFASPRKSHRLPDLPVAFEDAENGKGKVGVRRALRVLWRRAWHRFGSHRVAIHLGADLPTAGRGEADANANALFRLWLESSISPRDRLAKSPSIDRGS